MEKMTKVDVNWTMSLSACKFLEIGHKTHLSLAENKHPGVDRCVVQKAGGRCPLLVLAGEKRLAGGGPESCDEIDWRSRNHCFEQT